MLERGLLAGAHTGRASWSGQCQPRRSINQTTAALGALGFVVTRPSERYPGVKRFRVCLNVDAHGNETAGREQYRRCCLSSTFGRPMMVRCSWLSKGRARPVRQPGAGNTFMAAWAKSKDSKSALPAATTNLPRSTPAPAARSTSEPPPYQQIRGYDERIAKCPRQVQRSLRRQHQFHSRLAPLPQPLRHQGVSVRPL